MASLLLAKKRSNQRQYRDRNFQGSFEERELRLANSTTLYVGNLSFFTTEEQVFALFSQCGDVKRIIMGLDRQKKTPCGFCFVEYFWRADAENAVRFLSGTKLDDRVIRVDKDAGFEEGRQYGRGKSGGQVRDEYRTEYDEARGGFGKRMQEQELFDQSRVEGAGGMPTFEPQVINASEPPQSILFFGGKPPSADTQRTFIDNVREIGVSAVPIRPAAAETTTSMDDGDDDEQEKHNEKREEEEEGEASEEKTTKKKEAKSTRVDSDRESTTSRRSSTRSTRHSKKKSSSRDRSRTPPRRRTRSPLRLSLSPPRRSKSPPARRSRSPSSSSSSSSLSRSRSPRSRSHSRSRSRSRSHSRSRSPSRSRSRSRSRSLSRSSRGSSHSRSRSPSRRSRSRSRSASPRSRSPPRESRKRKRAELAGSGEDDDGNLSGFDD